MTEKSAVVSTEKILVSAPSVVDNEAKEHNGIKIKEILKFREELITNEENIVVRISLHGHLCKSGRESFKGTSYSTFELHR